MNYISLLHVYSELFDDFCLNEIFIFLTFIVVLVQYFSYTEKVVVVVVVVCRH